MLSIRSKLIAWLWALLTVLVGTVSVWNYYNTKQQLLHFFDTQLVQNNLALQALHQQLLAASIADQAPFVIILAQFLPMFCLWIILLALSWWVVYACVAPLNKISHAIALRQSDRLDPIDETNIPNEVKPMVMQINDLFARLTAAFAREKRFTADAAHELRTPLAALKIQAQVAIDATHAEERLNALNKVIQGVDRCTHLIEQLMLLTQIKPHEPLNNRVDVDLAALARETIAELSPSFIEKQIEIELIAETTQPSVMGNRIALSMMLRNIIDNAIRYSDPQTKISVSIIVSTDQVLFRVEDQGPGIPAELHERVFEQFYRGQQGVGSGLGLAIVEQIATLHHASIHLSVPEGQKHGLCFDVLFCK